MHSHGHSAPSSYGDGSEDGAQHDKGFVDEHPHALKASSGAQSNSAYSRSGTVTPTRPERRANCAPASDSARTDDNAWDAVEEEGKENDFRSAKPCFYGEDQRVVMVKTLIGSQVAFKH